MALDLPGGADRSRGDDSIPLHQVVKHGEALDVDVIVELADLVSGYT
jgi:hypothetical protein